MIYHGQEVGEPASGAEGFGGDDARTTIFDYWAMPEFQKWVNGGRFDGGGLSDEQESLRQWYADLLAVVKAPAFTRGEFYGLNHANKDNAAFGRLEGETASGHWLYAFLRRDAASGQSYLVVANFHGTSALEDVRIQLPDNALEWLEKTSGKVGFRERLVDDWQVVTEAGELPETGLALPDLPPLSARMLEIR